MAFFENFGKKISEVGYATMQKTREMADVSKLNSMITEEEKKLQGIYLQIGRQYVDLHMEDTESEFKEFLEQVKNVKRQIEDYKAEIEKIRGIIHCAKCGAEIPENAGFCSNCGAKVEGKIEAIEVTAKELVVSEPEEQEVIKKMCTNCHAELTPGALFCAECGTKVE